MSSRTWARSRQNLPEETWQPLEDHLANVAREAARFAAPFGAAGWAMLAGLWHDVGKCHPDFQRMLRDSARGNSTARVDHSSIGAELARACLGQALAGRLDKAHRTLLPLLVSMTIAGHHGRLAEEPQALGERLARNRDRLAAIARDLPEIAKGRIEVPPPPPRLLDLDAATPGRDRARSLRLRTEFMIRMLYSCLVDADRLDAERFADLDLPQDRRLATLRARRASIPALREALDEHIDALAAERSPGSLDPAAMRLHEYRQAVLAACRAAARENPGAFTLDVATGGGKTLAALSFALRHAERWGKSRVIVVIPYTSIIEQTAAVYRQALRDLGDEVLEHHSAVEEGLDGDELPSFEPRAERRRLATENWEAPLIVTTAVQFFESLFARTASRCRKCHNIANSVVVIDEAQVLPPGLLHPTVWALNELVSAYGASVVLSTATQPALEPPFPTLVAPRTMVPAEIAPPPPRVAVEHMGRRSLDWPELARSVASHPQALCIVHSRSDARNLTLEMDRATGDRSTWHLSANMCPAHRAGVLDAIKRVLGNGEPCRVVSTQLVEAGVDLDFPVVYRAMAGVDSLIQAAGRANREGRMGDRGGLLRVFQGPTEPPPGLLRYAKDAAEIQFAVAERQSRPLDLFSPRIGQEFFRRYFEKVANMDAGVTASRRELRFGETARTYRFIEDSGGSVAIPFDERSRHILDLIGEQGPTRGSLRALQRYVVSLSRWQFGRLLAAGALFPLWDGPEDARNIVHTVPPHDPRDLYDPRFGMVPDAADDLPAGATIV